MQNKVENIKRTMIKKIIITISLFVIIITSVISYLSLTRTTVIASDLYLSLLLEAQRQSEQLDSGITYPPSIDTDEEKIASIFSLLEQMRLEHNRVGVIAKSDWDNNKGKWDTYSKIAHRKRLPLIKEQLSLKRAIIDSHYNETQWNKMTPVEKEDAVIAIMGDRHTLKELPTLATCERLDELKAIDFEKLDGEITDPYEDFLADYTEDDVQGWLTVEQYKIIGMAAFENTIDEGCVYQDMGAGNIDAIDCVFDVQISSNTTAPNSIIITGGVAFGQAITQVNAWSSGVGFIAGLALRGTNTWRAYMATGAYADSDYYNGISNDTTYYPNIVRESGADTATYYLYSDSERTSLVDTMSVSGLNAQTWRYRHGINYINWTDTSSWYGFVENLDMREAEPDIYISPTSRNLGIVMQNGTYWTNTANSTPPSWPLTDGDAYFTVTNNGSMAVDITIKGTNFVGGSNNWTLVHTSPGSNEARWSAWFESGNLTDNTTFTTSEQSFISSLAASADIDIELRLETGTFDLTEGGTKTCTLTLTAGAS